MKLSPKTCYRLFVFAAAWHVCDVAADVRTVAPGVDLVAGTFVLGSQPGGNSYASNALRGALAANQTHEFARSMLGYYINRVVGNQAAIASSCVG